MLKIGYLWIVVQVYNKNSMLIERLVLYHDYSVGNVPELGRVTSSLWCFHL